MAGPPRVTVPLTPRGGRRSGGNDDDEVGAAGGAQAALTAEESRTVAETRDRFYGDQGGESIYDPETDRHIAEGLDAMLNDQELSDEQVAAIRGLADTPRDLDAGQTDVWDRLDAELNADAGAIRGSIYTGLQEDAQRRSESQGEAAGSVPVLPAEVNNDLAILRDILLTAEPAEGVSREQQAAAAAGIDAVLRGGTMTEEQSAAVAAAANSSSDTAFRMAAGFVGGSDFRGSLFAALAANRDAQTAQAGGIDRGAAAIAQGIRDAFEALTGGTAGAGILLPALTVGSGAAFSPAGYFDGGSNAAFVDDTGFLIANGSALADAGGVLTVIPGTGAAPVPQPGEAKYDRRYLLVANKTAGNLAVFVQYETIAASTGDWTWLPNDPQGRQAVGYRLAAGQELALKRDDWQLNARRVRIWAVAENGECYDQFRDEDLWLVEEQVNGERYYVASTVQTFPLAFGEEPGAR